MQSAAEAQFSERFEMSIQDGPLGSPTDCANVSSAAALQRIYLSSFDAAGLSALPRQGSP